MRVVDAESAGSRARGGVHLDSSGARAPIWIRDGPGVGVVNRTTSDEDIGNLINNRQNGRRRGRGGGQGAPRPNGPNAGQDRGNRVDNRARGNAAQLHEKYKALARDAQMQGDRVNTEYYLQFADHYFRVLSESRSRFEEQQPRARRDDFMSQPDEEYGDEGDRAGTDEQRAGEPTDARENGTRPRFDMAERQDSRTERAAERGDERHAGSQRSAGERVHGARFAVEPVQEGRPAQEERDEPRPEAARVEAVEPQPRRRGRPPKAKPADQIEVDRLPPAFGGSENDGQQDHEPEQEDAPRRRTRRPRAAA